MGLFDDIVNKATPVPGTAPATPLVPQSEPITGQTFQQTLEQSKLEDKGPGIFESLKSFATKAPKAVLNWIGTQKDHIFDNEDERMGITDWKKYKSFEFDVESNLYSPEQVQVKKQELFDNGVITQKYFDETQKQYDAQPKAYSSAQELQQKITRDLTSQIAPYMSQVQDVNQRRILTQAIETQTKTYMDYYNRIAEGHDSFQKDKYFTDLSSFMDKSKKFLSDYAEQVVAGSDNKDAFLNAQKKNINTVKEMDAWNSKLTTSSLWSSLSGSAKDIIDYDGVGETIGDIWGTITGAISLGSNLGWRSFTESPYGIPALTQKIRELRPGADPFIYNSGLEELYLDAVPNANQGFVKSSTNKIFQGIGEISDGADTLAQAAIPLTLGGGAGLLGRVENSARLTENLTLAGKATSYTKTVGVSMMQDAFIFDSTFTAFQRRGLNKEEIAQNMAFSLGANAIFVAAFARPVLKGAPEFREFLTMTGQDSRMFAQGEGLQTALNAGNTKQADRLLKQNMVEQSRAPGAVASEISEQEFLAGLTNEGKQNYNKLIQENNQGIKALTEDATSDTAFRYQQKLAKVNPDAGLPSEAKLAKQEATENQIIKDVIATPSLSGKFSLIGMNTSPEARSILLEALNKTQIDAGSVLQAGSPFNMTNELKESLLLKLLDVKNGTLTEATASESYLIGKTLENLHDIIKQLDPNSLQAIKRSPDLRLASELTSSVPVEARKLPDYLEMDKTIAPEIPATHTEFTQKTIDAPIDSDKTVESFLPAQDPGFLEQFKTRINKQFANPESGLLDLGALKATMDSIAGKTSLTDAQLDAFKLYHIGRLFDDFNQIKAVELIRDITDKTLFTSHPFFKLLSENGNKALVDIQNPRELNTLLGQLFLKAPRDNLYDLPVMKYVLKDEKFKATLVKSFSEITNRITTTDNAAEVWGLVDHMFMRASDIKFLEGQKPEVLERYIDLYIKQHPILEGSKYTKWVEDISTTAPTKYQDAALAFHKQVSEIVDKEPIFLHKETLKFALLAQGLDEVVSLQIIDEGEKAFSYARSSIGDILAKKNDLAIEKELLLPDAPRVLKIDEELAGLDQEIQKLTQNIKPIKSLENVNQVLDRVEQNEIFKGTFPEVVASLPTFERLVEAIDVPTVGFNQLRKNLAQEIAGTNLNQKDYRAIMQFLHIPDRILGKLTTGREEYLSLLASIQQAGVPKLKNFVEGYIYEQYSKSVKNFEKAIDNVRDALVRNERTALGFDALDNPQFVHPSQVPSGSYIIVGRSAHDPVKASKVQVEGSNQVQYKTLFEMLKFRNATDFTAPVFMTRNALANLQAIYARNPGSVAVDMSVMKSFINRVKILDIDISKSPKGEILNYIKRGYDDINTLSAAIGNNAVLFADTTKETLKNAVKDIAETYSVKEMDKPADFARVANVLDSVFKDTNTDIIWKNLKRQIPASDKFDILPFMQGRDFPAAYQAHLEKVSTLYPGAKEFPWFLDAFKLTEAEYHDYSVLYGLAKKTNKNLLDNIDGFTTKIKQAFIERLVVDKSTAAQKYATYKILDFLRMNGLVVPEETSARDLLSLVDGFAIETSAIIGRVAKDVLFDDTVNSKVLDGDKLNKWIAEIEQALKSEATLEDLKGAWGLEGETILSKIEGAEDIFGSSVDDTGAYISPEFTYVGPAKLESIGDPIEFFQALGKKLQKDITDITKNVYLGRNFVPYVNTERSLSKLLPSEFNQSVRTAWEQVVPNKPELFRDAKIYELDPSLIQKDKDSKFFVWNGEKTVELKSKDQARSELMFAIGRATRNGKGSRVPAFTLYVTPKDSPVTLNKKGYLSTPDMTYIDLQTAQGHRAYMTGAEDIYRSPLFQWAFADELAREESVYTIAKNWAQEFKKASPALKKGQLVPSHSADSVLRNIESFMGFKAKSRVNQSSSYMDYLGDFSPETYHVFGDIIPAREIESVRSIGYLPTGDIFDETGELLHSDVVANKYMFEWDGDKEFFNFFSQEDIGFGQLTEKFDLELPPDEIIEVIMKDGSVRRFKSEAGEIMLDAEITPEEFRQLGGESVSSSLFSRSANTKAALDLKETGEVAGKKYSYLFDAVPKDPDTATYRQVGETVTNLETGEKFKLGSEELSNDYLRSYFRKEQDLLDSASDFIC